MNTFGKSAMVQWGEAVRMSEKTRTWRGKQFNDSDGAVKTRWGLSALLALLLLVLLSTSAFPVMADSANVAMITAETNTFYENLQEAFGAAASGQTVQLLADIDSEAKAGSWPVTVAGDNDFTLDLAGHVIDRKQIGDGNVITVNGKLTLIDSSVTSTSSGTGVITGGKTSGDGGGIVINSGAVLTMNGGTIYGNRGSSDRSYGGGVYINGGTMTMTGGAAIKGNSTGGYGGGIFIESGGTFTLSGGEISGNTADYGGGGIMINSGSSMTMSGGAITGNSASYVNGGGVYGNGDAGSFTISGGTISGNTKNGAANNVYLNGEKIITVGDELSEETSIGITMQTPGVFTNSTNIAYNVAEKFTSDNQDYVVGKKADGTDAGQLFLGFSLTYKANGGTGDDVTEIYVSGSSVTVKDVTDSALSFTRDGYSFIGWNAEADGSGTAYADGASVTLTGNLTLYAQWAVASITTGSGEGAVTTYYDSLHKALNAASSGDTITLLMNISDATEGSESLIYNYYESVTLDLNGKTIDLSQINPTGQTGLAFIINDGNLTLKDGSEEQTGQITGGNGVMVIGGMFNMESGTITGCKNGVRIPALYITGGSLEPGGSGGTFNLSGGSITGNTVSGVSYETGTFNVSGNPSVTGNGTDTSASGIKGNVVLGALPDKKITVTGSLNQNARLGITLAFHEDDDTTNDTLSTVFTSGLSGKGSAINFTSDNSNYAVGIVEEGQSAGEAYLTEPKYTVTYNGNLGTGESLLNDVTMPTDTSRYASGGVVTVKSASGLYKSDSSGKVSIATGWNTNADGTGNSYAGDGTATFTIKADTTLYAQWTPAVAKIERAANNTLYFTTLQDAVAAAQATETIIMIAPFTMNEAVTIDKDLTLDLNGYEVNAGSIGPAVSVSDTGDLTLTDQKSGGGSLTCNANSSCVSVSGILMMNGGSISNPFSPSSETPIENAAVKVVSGGAFTQTGGSVTAYVYGVVITPAGGPSIPAGSFTLNGNRGSVTVTGKDSVGVLNSGNFELINGSVSSTGTGSIGVQIAGGGSLTVSGGTIDGGESGTGVSYLDGTFNLEGAPEISGAQDIYLAAGKTIKITGNLTNDSEHKYGVTLESGYGPITYDLDANTTEPKGSINSFSSDMAGFTLGMDDGGEAILGYTVTFDPNGGTGTVPERLVGYPQYPAETETPAVPAFNVTAPTGENLTKTGYHINGWSTVSQNYDTGTHYAVDAPIPVSADITLYAQWDANNYTVKFDKNADDATGTMEPQIFLHDDEEEPLSANAFSLTGYVFGGWNTVPDPTTETGTAYGNAQRVKNLTAEQNGEITLYAQWSANSYTVKFDMNAADATGTMADMSFKYDETKALTANGFSYAGYRFTGWNTVANPTEAEPGTSYADGASVSNLTTAADGEVTLYAQWSANSYTVKFNGNGNTNTVSVADQVFTYGVEQALNANQYERVFTVTYKYNDATGGNTVTSASAQSSFNGWAKTADGAKEYDDKASVSNLTAVNNGTVDLFANWTDNGTVTLPTPTRTGQSFGGWYKDQDFSDDKKAGNGGASYTPTGSETLYAKWDGISYTITLPEVGTIGAEFTVMVNGTELTTAPFQAKYNDTVVVIYKPNDSFLAASSLHISDSENAPVSFTPAQTADVTAETSYTFAMPDKNVTVDALIVKAPVAKANLIYNGQAQELTTAAVFNNKTVLYYATADNTITSETISAYKNQFKSGIWKETNAGTYYVWYATQGFDYTGGPIKVTIAQRPVTITAKDQSLTVGTAIAQGVDQVTIAAETPLVEEHGLELAEAALNGNTASYTTDGEITITLGSVKIKSGNDDVTANYALTLNPGKLTVGLPPVRVISEDGIGIFFQPCFHAAAEWGYST